MIQFSKMGRPKSTNPKSTQLAVRLDTKELQKLDEIAKELGITRVEAIRKGIDTLYGLICKGKS